jgi:methylmalonyl-CoA mutase N-terminal domain/subunit
MTAITRASRRCRQGGVAIDTLEDMKILFDGSRSDECPVR